MTSVPCFEYLFALQATIFEKTKGDSTVLLLYIVTLHVESTLEEKVKYREMYITFFQLIFLGRDLYLHNLLIELFISAVILTTFTLSLGFKCLDRLPCPLGRAWHSAARHRGLKSAC